MNPDTPTLRYSSVWPNLNKQDHIDGYFEQLRSGDFTHCTAQVDETVYLNCWEWHEFLNHLLEDRAWLAGKGGCHGPGVRSVIQVVAPGVTPAESLAILVDPQGYDYARYVGFYVRETPTERLITNPPNLLCLADVMTTTLDGVSFKDRVFARSMADRQARLQELTPA